jgi:hypothetical protein
VSIYNFLKYTWRAWRDSDLMDNISSLDEFVNSKFFRGPGPDRIHMPQIRWLFDSNKQICIENLARLETLEEDLALICKALNLPRALASLERKNVSKVPDAAYMQSFSGAAVDAIRRRYELDFEHLKYSRDPDALLARKVGSRDFLHLRGHV